MRLEHDKATGGCAEGERALQNGEGETGERRGVLAGESVALEGAALVQHDTNPRAQCYSTMGTMQYCFSFALFPSVLNRS